MINSNKGTVNILYSKLSSNVFLNLSYSVWDIFHSRGSQALPDVLARNNSAGDLVPADRNHLN